MSPISALLLGFASAALLTVAVPAVSLAQQHNYTKEVVDQLVSGKHLIETEKYNEARKIFTKLIAEKPDCADAYNGVGVTFMRQGNYKAAEASLMKAAQLDPLNIIVLNNLGLSMSFQGKFKESIVYYKQALELAHDNDVEIQTNLANALAETDQLDEAYNHYQQALKLKPDNASAYKGLAEMYYNHGKYKDAVQCAQQAVKIKSDYSTAYYTLGVAQSALKNFPAAEVAFKQSLKYEKNPQYARETQALIDKLHVTEPPPVATVTPKPAAPALSQTAVDEINALMKERKWRQAEQKINAQIIKGNGDAVMYNNLGLALVHLNDDGSGKSYERACEAYRKAIDARHGPFPTAEYNLGQALRLLGKTDQAEAAFKQSIADARQLRAPCPLSQVALGLILKQRGDLNGADKAYRVALGQSGNELPVIHYNLGLLLEKRGNKMREAAREYQKYLSLAPHGLNAKQARSRLKRLGIEPGA